jgi:hypothetical protein
VPGPIDHGSELDPISYIRGIGLQPEDCYGFLPIEHQDMTPYFFLYRDRPEYKERRDKLPLAMPRAGAIPMNPEQQTKIDMDQELVGGSEGMMGQKIADAVKMAESFGAQPLSEWTPTAAPNPEKLERLANLLASGAITNEEYMKLVQEATSGAAAHGAEQQAAVESAVPAAGSIVAHRLYPAMRRRVSTRQLDHFLPRYRDTLKLASEDVYGVLPRVTRLSTSDGDQDLEWDDFWIVYRDRPEYAAGREAWAAEMDKDKWPEAVTVPGVSEPSGAAFDGAKVETEKDVWPRSMLVMRKRSDDLGDAIRQKISKWGYEPEDSMGFCPSFRNEGIYFAWRKS